MYSTSTEFHEAVFAQSPVERVLFQFADGTVFTNEDINAQVGMTLVEAANLEEAMPIGACPASSLSVCFMNHHGLLSGYSFGECAISLGVRTGLVQKQAVNANAYIVLRYGQGDAVTITGHSDMPYVRIDGSGAAMQPPFPVHATFASGNLVFFVGADGEVWQAAWVDGQTWEQISTLLWSELETKQWDSIQGQLIPISYMTGTLWEELGHLTWDDMETTAWNDLQGHIVVGDDIIFNDFMTHKFKAWAQSGRGIAHNANMIYEFYTDGRIEAYEYAKLGTFNIDEPAKRKVNTIFVTAYDKMTLFDVEADDFWNGLSYPITVGEIYHQLCDFVGIDSATITFINSTRSFDEPPFLVTNVTAREILGWVAEAACSFARMTRDGELELAWFSENPVNLQMTQCFAIDPAEHLVSRIDKLQILNSELDVGTIIGEGTNGYQIMDNPFLYGQSDAEIRSYGVPIYNRLHAFAPFAPVNAIAICDWSIQAGDIISVTLKDETYFFPVYCQTITWNGSARVSYESTGAKQRPVMDATNRRIFQQDTLIHEMRITVDEFSSEMITKDGVISAINQTPEEIRIAAARIALEGAITANSYFKINTDGSMEAISGEIGGLTISPTGLASDYLSILADGQVKLGSYFHLYETQDGMAVIQAVGSGSALAVDAVRVTLGAFPSVTIDPYLSLNTYRTDPSGGPYVPNARIDTDTGEIYRTTHGNSSILVKKNVQPLGNEAARSVYNLEPIYYQYKDINAEKMEIGLIAEDVEDIFPELVYRDGSDISIAYDRLSVLLLAELKRLHESMEGKDGIAQRNSK